MYIGQQIVIKKGSYRREIVSTTDNPFDWFPELESIFNNFHPKSLEMELDNFEEGIERRFFKIIFENK